MTTPLPRLSLDGATVYNTILMFTVYGCSNIESIDGATVWRNAESAAVMCNNTGETWYLTCQNNQWTGSVGNCTKTGKRFF